MILRVYHNTCHLRQLHNEKLRLGCLKASAKANYYGSFLFVPPIKFLICGVLLALVPSGN